MEAPVVKSVSTPLAGVGSHRRTGEHGEKALMTLWRNLVVALVAAFALAACSSSGDNGDTSMPMPTDPGPSAYEMALEAIAAAETAEAAQKVVDDLDADAVTGAQLQSLNMAVAQKTAELAAAAAAAERQALVTAAMCAEATAACVAAHDALIAALQADVDRLADDENATNAQQAAAQMALDEATATRNTLQMQVTEIDRSTDLGAAVGAAVDAANGLADMRSADDIANAEMLLATARGMHTEDDDYADQIAMAQMAIDRAKARNAADMAVMAAQTASGMLTDDQSKATVEAARAAVNAAKQAVMDNADALTDADESGFNAQIALAEAPVGPLESKIAADEEAEKQRLAEEEEEEQRKANEAMAATAAKLYAGISAPTGDANSLAANDRAAAYNDAGTPTGATVDTHILVSNSGDTALTAAFVLSEDKKTMVAANHGWAGKRYADPAGGDEYEAFVYSNVEAPTPGRKFGAAGVTETDDDREFQYALTNGGLTFAQLTATGAAARIALTGVTRTAGTETFELPDPNTGNRQNITVPGSFHGVAGNYICDTGSARTDACTAAVAGEGFTLAGAWTFTPTNAEARVMDSVDTAYASYGWWLLTAADGSFTASAFHDVKGAVTPLVETTLTGLQGTANYMGGAAGKYALSSSTGGTNDAGHFTARAMLEADFGDGTAAGTITGTIDQFMGADGMSRDWSVELKEAVIAFADPNASLTRTEDDDTVWTIGETAAAASGEWSGSLRDQGEDGVPNVATGTFYSEFGTAGKMVGAFGANEQ